MRTVTLEEHFSTPEVVKATAHLQSGSRSGFVEVVRGKLLDVGEGRIADMDADGIDVQVLSLVNSGMDKLDSATATPLVRNANDQLAAAVRKHPDRLAAFAALALQDPKTAAAEFERCVCKLGFKGALVHGTTNGVFLDQPQFTPLFETAQALDVPIYLHPTPASQPVQDAYYGGLPGNTGFFLSTAAWGWRGTRDALPAPDCFRIVRPLSETQDHHRTHGGKSALFDCPRRFDFGARRQSSPAPGGRLFL